MTYLEEFDVEPEILEAMRNNETTKPLMCMLDLLEEEQRKREETELEEQPDKFTEENQKVFVKSLYNW